MCQGYYRHSEGYTPQWDGMETFKGTIVHPQTWPTDFDYAGKNVVVIGSGATAATLIPAMAEDVGHVTMLQRSPTYFRTGRNAVEIADELRALAIDETWIHEIVRRKILHDQSVFTGRAFSEPETVKRELLGAVRSYLGPDYDVDTHFTPRYRPWRQRIAFIPDGDLFQGIRTGKASIVTDEIERFVETGIVLKSGKQLDADIIVTATGFNLNVLGDRVHDRRPTAPTRHTVTYRGMMFTRHTQHGLGFGYFGLAGRARRLVRDFVCRLLNHMSRRARKGPRRVSGLKTRTCRYCPGSIRRTSIRATLCGGCTCCRSAATRRNGSTPRTTGTKRTSSPPSTSTARSSSTSKGLPPYLPNRIVLLRVSYP
jgi:cation diffusion facilitator CzcD-associated flavoprotein CzcO